MDPRRSVLIADAMEETREVLRTALERRGVRILSARRADQALAMAREHRPDLIVYDLELEPVGDDASQARPGVGDFAPHTPLVILGNARRAPPGISREQFVPKPYHYAPLIRRIEALLTESAGSSV